MPAPRPTPSTIRVPWSETWRGFLRTGSWACRLTRLIRTEVTCKETCTAAALVAGAGARPAPARLSRGRRRPGGAARPGARLSAGAAPTHSNGATSAPARMLLRSCTCCDQPNQAGQVAQGGAVLCGPAEPRRGTRCQAPVAAPADPAAGGPAGCRQAVRGLGRL